MTCETIEQARAEIFEQFARPTPGLLWDEYAPWVVSYSGGKDSTLLLLLVLDALRRFGRLRPARVIFSDTGIEQDGIVERVERNFRGLRELATRENLDVRTSIIRPLRENSYFVEIVGNGAAAPYPPQLRWCVNRLKQKPICRWKRAEFRRSRFVTLTGERFAESKHRNEAMTARLDDDGYYREFVDRELKKGGNAVVRQTTRWERVYAPIRNVSTSELWSYLGAFDVYPWGESRDELLAQYGAERVEEIVADGKERRSGCRFCTFCRKFQHGEATPEKTFLRKFADFSERRGDVRNLIMVDKLDGWYNVPEHFKSNQNVIEGNFGVGRLGIEGRAQVWEWVKEMEAATGRVWIDSEDEKIIYQMWERDRKRIERGELVDARKVLKTS